MIRIEKYEDLICRQKSGIFVKEVYNITSTGLFGKDY